MPILPHHPHSHPVERCQSASGGPSSPGWPPTPRHPACKQGMERQGRSNAGHGNAADDKVHATSGNAWAAGVMQHQGFAEGTEWQGKAPPAYSTALVPSHHPCHPCALILLPPLPLEPPSPPAHLCVKLYPPNSSSAASPVTAQVKPRAAASRSARQTAKGAPGVGPGWRNEYMLDQESGSIMHPWMVRLPTCLPDWLLPACLPIFLPA